MALLFFLTATFIAFDMPTGWHKAGSHPDSYEMGLDKGAGKDGRNAATIKSIDKKINGFGTLMQNCRPDKYLGKRVLMSGMMKTKDLSGYAAFWFRVDQPNSDITLSFDNMYNRSIKGTTDWKKYEIVLDVPSKASNLAYGALIAGTGQIWFDELTFETVEETIPTTDGSNNQMPLKEPTNLDFEK